MDEILAVIERNNMQWSDEGQTLYCSCYNEKLYADITVYLDKQEYLYYMVIGATGEELFANEKCTQEEVDSYVIKFKGTRS